jgi:polar amino acid transport system substrate-binding protein
MRKAHNSLASYRLLRTHAGNATAIVALLALTFVAVAALAATGPARLYTDAQAVKGQGVYMKNCASCHGPNEQGKSGPAVGGSAFLKRMKLLGWSVADLQNVVVSTMPRSNPGSLSQRQYSDVLAYLLAVNCFPAGQSRFPTKTTPKLTRVHLLAPKGATPDNQKLGTCTLHKNG